MKLNSRPELTNLFSLNPGEGVRRGPAAVWGRVWEVGPGTTSPGFKLFELLSSRPEFNNLHNLNPEASPVFKLFDYGREVNNLDSFVVVKTVQNKLNPEEVGPGASEPRAQDLNYFKSGRELNNLDSLDPEKGVRPEPPELSVLNNLNIGGCLRIYII